MQTLLRILAMAGGVLGRRWVSDDTRDQIFRLARAGKTTREIAAATCVCTETVRQYAKRSGVKPALPPSRWTREQIDLIATLAADGAGVGRIAKHLGRSRDSTGRTAKKFGIRIVPTGNRKRRLRLELPDQTWARLEQMAAEIDMKPAATARMIVMAVARDPFLWDSALTPAHFVEKPEQPKPACSAVARV
jgi:hypothetical protein